MIRNFFSANSIGPRRFLCLVFAFGLALASSLDAKRIRVIMDASASEEYLEATSELPYQTYHFYKGKYYGGVVKDPKLEGTTFEEITLSVAEALKERDFYPEPDKEKGDLLVVVSWGRTIVDPDYQELMDVTGEEPQSYEESLSGDSGGDAGGATGPSETGSVSLETIQGGLGQGSGASGSTTGGSYRQRLNSKLLGFEKNLQKSYFPRVDKEELLSALDEDRYFIILNAFDYQLLRQTGELKQLWTSRYSTRAAGVSFTDAYTSMNKAAAGTFGVNMAELGKTRVDTKSKVVIGEVEVISRVEERELKAKAKEKE